MVTQKTRAFRVNREYINRSSYIQYFVFSFIYNLENFMDSLEKKRLFVIVFKYQLKLSFHKKKNLTTSSARRTILYSLSSASDDSLVTNKTAIRQLIEDGFLLTKVILKGNFSIKPTQMAEAQYSKTLLSALAEKESLSFINWLNVWSSQTYLPMSKFKIEI